MFRNRHVHVQQVWSSKKKWVKREEEDFEMVRGEVTWPRLRTYEDSSDDNEFLSSVISSRWQRLAAWTQVLPIIGPHRYASFPYYIRRHRRQRSVMKWRCQAKNVLKLLCKIQHCSKRSWHHQDQRHTHKPWRTSMVKDQKIFSVTWQVTFLIFQWPRPLIDNCRVFLLLVCKSIKEKTTKTNTSQFKKSANFENHILGIPYFDSS